YPRTRLDWARWPPVAVCGRSGAAVGLVVRELLAARSGCGTSCGSSRRTAPGPTMPHRPRPGPCRRTARCGARRGPAHAHGRLVPAAAVAVAWWWLEAAWADAACRSLLGARPRGAKVRPCRAAQHFLVI